MTWNFKNIFKICFFVVFVFVVLTFGLKYTLKDREDILNILPRSIENGFVWNNFLQADGLFSFEYRSDYDVFFESGIYYVKAVKGGNVVFQIFKETDDVIFDEEFYTCKNDICYTGGISENAVRNIKLNVDVESDRFEFLTRAEALKWVLKLRYPEKDFSIYADNCFVDVPADYKFSQYICFAKENKIVVGIGENFYPENSINLWGILKILFVVFDVDYSDGGQCDLDDSWTYLMSKYHYAYNLFEKAYCEGIVRNVMDSDIWPNRHVYKSEARDIIYNFLAWNSGEILRSYADVEHKIVNKVFNIYVKKYKEGFDFIKIDFELNLKNIVEFEFLQVGDDLELYAEKDGEIYVYIGTLRNVNKLDIKNAVLDYDFQKRRGKLRVDYINDEKIFYKLTIGVDAFSKLETKKIGSLDDPNLLPNDVDFVVGSDITRVDVFFSDDDFESIMENRTLTTRYPASVRILYRNGSVEKFSALIKTRGNANRGYIKSSYTVESFTPLNGGDLGFLNHVDEFKLRSLISDESLTREKIVYYLFKELGYISPDFTESILYINNIPFGFYQLTEAIKPAFFEKRNLDTNYYYARNITSLYPANMTYYKDENITDRHYKMRGGGDASEVFQQFLYQIKHRDKKVLKNVDIQNVFDYAFSLYALNLYDSSTHNYYMYKENNKWKMFFWDADTSLYSIPSIGKNEFLGYIKNAKEDDRNDLVAFVFEEMTDDEFNVYWDDLISRWKKIDLVERLDQCFISCEKYYKFDNELWNGRYIERKNTSFNTSDAIDNLNSLLLDLESQISVL